MVGPEVLSFDNPVPRPFNLDIICLLRTGVIREEGNKYHFYEPGETPKEMRKVGRVEAKSARKLEQRLAKLEEMETKLCDIEDTIYKTRRSQLQLLNIINQSQMYQGDSFAGLRNICAEFMAKVWSLAKANFAGELETDRVFEDLLNRAFDGETRRVKEARREAGTSKAGEGSEAMEKEGTPRRQSPVDTTVDEENPTKEAEDVDEEINKEGEEEGEKATPPPPPLKQTKKAPRKSRGR